MKYIKATEKNSGDSLDKDITYQRVDGNNFLYSLNPNGSVMFGKINFEIVNLEL